MVAGSPPPLRRLWLEQVARWPAHLAAVDSSVVGACSPPCKVAGAEQHLLAEQDGPLGVKG
eukprot:5013680-Lingulodinium_polyedra.AAC.1